MFKKSKKKSMLVQILDIAERPPLPIFTLLVIFAILCDTLRAIGYILGCIIIAILLCGMVAIGIVWYKASPLYDEYMAKAEEATKDTDANTFRYNETSVIYDKTGKVLASLSQDRDTVYLSYEDLPMNAVNAMIAIEDRTFWTNPGIDYKGIGRVILKAALSRGEDLAGASTITQQLARSIFLSSDVSLDRKFTEMAIAIKLTEKYSKEEIMEFYLNNCYFANGYYGIETAAEGYFGRQAKDLTLGEIAYLCAIPNSPTYYDPRVNPDRAYERRDNILDAMYELGYISKEDCENAKYETYTIAATADTLGGYAATYAIDCTVRWFMQLDGFKFQYHFDTDDEYDEYMTTYNEEYDVMRDELYRGGYTVYTSIDPAAQDSLQDIADEYVKGKRASLGYDDFEAAVVLTNKEGMVQAIIGGAGGSNFGFNRGYQAYRQPGSTIKPLVVYTPAIEEGYMANSPVKNLSVSEVQKQMKAAQARGERYDISSASGQTVTLRYALEQSLNGVAYSLMNKVSPKKCLSYLEKMHFSQILPEDYTLSASLGGFTNGATPVEMAGGYACILNDGMYNEPTCITSIIDRYGKERYKKKEAEQVYSEYAANLMTDLMSGVPKTGTAASLNWYGSSNATLYCKTGTTDDKKDNWLCGFAGDNVLSVWIGCDTPKNLGTFGSSGAGVLFKSCMLKALEINPSEEELEKTEEKTEDELIIDAAEKIANDPWSTQGIEEDQEEDLAQTQNENSTALEEETDESNQDMQETGTQN